MENITQENIDKVVNNFNKFKLAFDKMSGIVEDLNNCNSDYSKTILFSAISKMAEQVGLKDKIFE